MPDSIRHHFDESIHEMRHGAVQLAGLVLENIERTSEAVLENRLDLVERVVDADEEIDDRYIELERGIFALTARQQPVAGDLRLVLSILRILHELERSGDLAVNTVKALNRSTGFDLPPRLRAVLARLCRSAADLFARGIDVLADMNPQAGAALDEEDDVVDDLVDKLYGELLAPEQALPIDVALELSLVARYMERIADHAVNIGDHVSFIVTGVFPDHEQATA